MTGIEINHLKGKLMFWRLYNIESLNQSLIHFDFKNKPITIYYSKFELCYNIRLKYIGI